MIRKCLSEYLPIRPQPSTSTGRALWCESRGLVGTWVEGRVSLIHFIQARNRSFVEGVDTYSQITTKRKRALGREGRKAYRDNNRTKYLHPLLPQAFGLAAMEASGMTGLMYKRGYGLVVHKMTTKGA
jgi:hypothetical protein